MIHIYDALGRVVFGKEFYDKNITLDLSQFGKGIYVLKAETSTGKTTKKLVID